MSGLAVSKSLLSLPTSRKNGLMLNISRQQMQWKISVEVDEYIFLAWPVEWVPDLHPSLFLSSLYGFGSCLNNRFGKRIPFADSLMSARQLGCCAHT